MLSSKDKASIVDCMADLIKSSEQTGKRYIPDASAENIYGTDDLAFVLDCEFPFEFVETPVAILESQSNTALDATISILPEQEMKEDDRIEFEGTTYKVITVEALNVFGVISHKVVKAVKLYP